MNVNLNIIIDNVNIYKVSKPKFLGIIINENSSWEDHIILVETEVSKNICVIWKIRNTYQEIHCNYYITR